MAQMKPEGLKNQLQEFEVHVEEDGKPLGGRVERQGHDQKCSVESDQRKVMMASGMRPRDVNGLNYGGGMKM